MLLHVAVGVEHVDGAAGAQALHAAESLTVPALGLHVHAVAHAEGLAAAGAHFDSGRAKGLLIVSAAAGKKIRRVARG